MILLTRLDGSRVGINEEQIERLDEAPTTVVTLMNGNRYVVAESVDTVVELIVEFQARVMAQADRVTRRRPRPAERRRAAHLVLATPPQSPSTSPE